MSYSRTCSSRMEALWRTSAKPTLPELVTLVHRSPVNSKGLMKAPEWQQHQVLLSQLLFLGFMRWLWNVATIRRIGKMPFSIDCHLLRPVFSSSVVQSRQVHAHPAHRVSPALDRTLCLWTAQWTITLKWPPISSQLFWWKEEHNFKHSLFLHSLEDTCPLLSW